ncbi:hypothetical protein AUK11_00485 [bacterium CG2_30_37_16]|nr:MAG: hypothetical protein AUK11_00485 [bacterium CG2_30_37_16]PIP30395.1 MAG: hypothetical protein COX25_04885 [bacterium (Candidatus Howlettbacteria) CG23_combo_of_CG06-09_8_20_14_all_37_9]PIX98673.1 MAG: hypothetical protein COZ22_04430 [bacterium (Candidatus Howlettbacteria) CG_4_10_14_3_um_filter_37_10]PJB05880.1 MAG: hypothetical protein CO123_03155 [bacterium (Candidatus Howlettbacteria) CG_4_9_14_3_um_filter_37_10]
MLNSSVSTIIAQKISPIISKKIVLIDKKGHYLASTYPANRTKIYEISKDPTIFPIYQNGSISGYVKIDEPLSVAKPLATAVKSMVELLVNQIEMSENISSKDQRQDKLIYDILNNENLDEDIAQAEARIFDINLTHPRIVLTVLIDGEKKEELFKDDLSMQDKELILGRYKKGIQRGFVSFYTRLNSNVIAYFGKNLFVVLKDLGERKEEKKNALQFETTLKTIHQIIKDELRCNVTIGVGSYHHGIKGLKDSFKEAYLASELGEELWGSGKVFNINDFGVVAPLLSGLNEKNLQFSQRMLKKIAKDEEMGKTVEVFLDSNMSLTKTSKILKIHRNTLVYRLDKITENLGLDPRNFEDAVQLKLAMLFNQFSAGSEVVVK